MKVKLLIFLAAVILSACSKSQNRKPAVAVQENILILGNSMTIHPPKAVLGWYGNWGMAATTRDADFVHILATKLNANVDPVNMSAWENNPADYNLDQLLPNLERNPYLIIIRLGENVFSSNTFGQALDDLLVFLKLNAAKSQVVVTGTFWSNTPVNDALKEFSKRHSLKFISLSHLETNANISFIGAQTMGDDGRIHAVINAGVAAHPGDAGMRGIAETILLSLLPR